jgi:cytochrome b6
MSPNRPPDGAQHIAGRIYRWFDRRYQLESLLSFMKEKSVPAHGSMMWYYCGGATLFFFIVQVITGILLLMYYVPSSDSAYESIHFIMSKVQFGWLIRSIHSWSANLMILAAFIHLFSVFFSVSYRRPRELTWVSGMVMLFLAMGFGFSGYLLPWNELSFFATKVGTDMVGKVPFVGHQLLVILRGGENVTGATLTRFFGLHVAILPGVFTIFLAAHMLFIQRQGIADPVEWEKRPPKEKSTMPFFPNFLLRDLLFWMILLNVLAVLAVFFPWELGEKADPFKPAPAGIKPEWYFMFVFQSLKQIPAHVMGMEGELVGMSFFGLVAAAALFLPFWDRSAARGKRSIILTILAIVFLAFMLVMTVWAYVERPPV